MLSVGFFTLLERKILRLSQLRLGPNKTLFMGLIQPILDGVKLIKKIMIVNIKVYQSLFFLTSFLILFNRILLWISFSFYLWRNKSLYVLWILLIFGISMFVILLIGWSSINKYRILGGIRRLTQVLRFEVLFSLLILINCFLLSSLSFKKNLIFLNFPLMLILFILIIIEVQRTPIDLSEGERELVRGYNIEYRRFLFILVFLGEYSILVFFSLIFLKLFSLINIFSWVINLLIFLILRRSFPRIRYDQLLNFSWIKLLPLVILIWFLYFYLKF